MCKHTQRQKGCACANSYRKYELFIRVNIIPHEGPMRTKRVPSVLVSLTIMQHDRQRVPQVRAVACASITEHEGYMSANEYP